MPSPIATAHAKRLSISTDSSRSKMEQFTFTLGKLDAGMAILLGPNAHLLEFPSLLLPTPSPGTPPLGPGSILTITVSRDLAAEYAAQKAFRDLQNSILNTFSVPPKVPVVRLRNVTQTNVTIEWDRIDVGSAELRGLEMHRNGQRWGRVGGEYGGGEREKTEWKTGGLQSGEEYTFQLVLKTTAGTYPSNIIRVRTHTMDNLTGLLICFGPLHPPQLVDQLRHCLRQIGARESPYVALDTTHFVCTTPMVGSDEHGRGGGVDPEYQEALRMNLPVVGPGWLFAVADQRKLFPISSYILPPLPSNTSLDTAPPPFRRPSPLKRASLPIPSAPQSPIKDKEDVQRSPSPETIARMSMVPASPTLPSHAPGDFSEQRRESLGAVDIPSVKSPRREAHEPSRSRSPKPEADGKLDRGFKFPLSNPTSATSSSSQSSPLSRSQISPSTTGDAQVPVTDLASTLVSAPGAAQATFDYADIPVQSFSPPAEIEEEVKRISTPPIVVEEPRVATEQLPTKTEMHVQINGQQEREEGKAQTIDEAVKKFDDVVSGAASNLHEESPAPSILPMKAETATTPGADYHAAENSQTGPLENPKPLEQSAASSEEPPSEESTTKAAETNVLPEAVESVQLIPVKDAQVEDGTGEKEDMDSGSRSPGSNVKIDKSPSPAKKEEDTHSNVEQPKEATIADPEPPSDIVPETVTQATPTPAGSNRSTPVSKSQKKKNKKKKKAQASATATAPREESEANGNDEGLEDIDLN
ncbi:cell wall chitin catabolism-related protein, putative [Cryptococcus gattii WM276]|uniref:Cell wall chitin catabolism-related protein, putative n=1 Tax=Cryptococcus gattii serotype B (strain WM276 / ATCC MYA-4071) TaxID=367775 RepID=E6RAW9_CRYGW|nr:cell wall chitin catabolism-related protein, putative [Cryptococcus gattii WM276]ADV24009.1 cell wall chitin catabolism-related protein, putative [Cryptococcus gattii WM276]